VLFITVQMEDYLWWHGVLARFVFHLFLNITESTEHKVRHHKLQMLSHNLSRLCFINHNFYTWSLTYASLMIHRNKRLKLQVKVQSFEEPCLNIADTCRQFLLNHRQLDDLQQRHRFVLFTCKVRKERPWHQILLRTHGSAFKCVVLLLSSSYFTGDTLRLRYRVQPVNAM
jgi:hypothetical protein